MSIDTHNLFARITRVDSPQAGTVLCRFNLLCQTMAVLVISSGWCALTLIGLYLTRQGAAGATVSLGIFVLSLVWVGTVCTLAFVYPEWPHNRRLCRQLLRSIEHRDDAIVSSAEFPVRIVELVPRDRWRKPCLDTATDLTTLRVDPQGVWMEGDRNRYQLPCESILGAQYHAITPPGWFCHSHMAIIYVRTEEGTIELPVSYRDFAVGSLRSSRRYAQTIALVEEITRIAKGNQHQPPPSIRVDPSPRRVSWSTNPYASPAIERE